MLVELIMQHLHSFLLVFLGGGIGSALRFGIALIAPPGTGRFPWATLVANGIACLILGFILGMHLNGQMPDQRRLLLGTGLCGGLSTFSTFISENWALYENGQPTLMLVNTLVSLVLCFICLLAGLKMAF